MTSRTWIPFLLGFAALSLACGGGEAETVDSWLVGGGDDTQVGGGDDTGGGGDDTGSEIKGAEFVGGAWMIDLSEGTMVQPAGMGSLMEGTLSRAPIVFEVLNAQPGSLRVRFGASDGLDQDLCMETEEETVDYSGSTVRYAAAVRASEFEGAQIRLEDVELSGVPSTGDWEKVRVQAKIDTRYMGPVIAGDDDPNAICEMVAGFGLSCEECADGKMYCLPMLVEDAVAYPFSEGVERVGSDCPDCQEECVPMSCTVGVGGQGSLLVLGLLGALVLRRREDALQG